MRIKIAIIGIYISLSTLLSAAQPLLVKLQNIISNEKQRFGVDNYSFICTPYGVTTLEKLYVTSSKESGCKNSIERFYIKNPHLKFFTAKLLKTQQLYHIEIKNKECVLYAKGEITLSELLLREGLAIYKESLKDEEFVGYFSLAQRGARAGKKGLWGENIFKECKATLAKE